MTGTAAGNASGVRAVDPGRTNTNPAATPPGWSDQTQPAATSYLRARGETAFRAFKIDVLRVAGSAIAEITTFDTRLFAAFGLPLAL
jgi:hypothetical protein